MFTKKDDFIQIAKDSMNYENERFRNERLRTENDKLEAEKTRLTRIIRRLLEFHGVKENYIGYRIDYPDLHKVPYFNVDRLDADLEAVYAVTKADAARARLTKTEKEAGE